MDLQLGGKEIAVTGTSKGIGEAIAFGAVPVSLQIWMFTASHSHFEAGSALITTVFQPPFASKKVKLRIQIGKTFRVDDIAMAHRRMEENRSAGKIVVLT